MNAHFILFACICAIGWMKSLADTSLFCSSAPFEIGGTLELACARVHDVASTYSWNYNETAFSAKREDYDRILQIVIADKEQVTSNFECTRCDVECETRFTSSQGSEFGGELVKVGPCASSVPLSISIACPSQPSSGESSLKLSCEIDDPKQQENNPIGFKWIFQNIARQDGKIIGTNSVLELEGITKEDAGIYTCVVDSLFFFGEVETVVNITPEDLIVEACLVNDVATTTEASTQTPTNPSTTTSTKPSTTPTTKPSIKTPIKPSTNTSTKSPTKPSTNTSTNIPTKIPINTPKPTPKPTPINTPSDNATSTTSSAEGDSSLTVGLVILCLFLSVVLVGGCFAWDRKRSKRKFAEKQAQEDEAKQAHAKLQEIQSRMYRQRVLMSASSHT